MDLTSLSAGEARCLKLTWFTGEQTAHQASRETSIQLGIQRHPQMLSTPTRPRLVSQEDTLSLYQLVNLEVKEELGTLSLKWTQICHAYMLIMDQVVP